MRLRSGGAFARLAEIGPGARTGALQNAEATRAERETVLCGAGIARSEGCRKGSEEKRWARDFEGGPRGAGETGGVVGNGDQRSVKNFHRAEAAEASERLAADSRGAKRHNDQPADSRHASSARTGRE